MELKSRLVRRKRRGGAAFNRTAYGIEKKYGR